MLSPRALTTLNPVLLEGGTTRTDGRQRESTQDFSTVKGGGKENIINILNPGQTNDLAISRKERGKEKEKEKKVRDMEPRTTQWWKEGNYHPHNCARTHAAPYMPHTLFHPFNC